MSRTVIITGCSSGIGRATALFFAHRNWNVVATMRRPESASPEFGPMPNVLLTRLDVEDISSIHSAIDAGIARFGAIDALINNAGHGLPGIFEAIPPEKVRAIFDVNVLGLMNTTRAILPHFRSRKSGVIVNVGSGSGVFALPTVSMYCATKFALEGFSEALWYELASQGIRMKIVEAGGVFSTEFRRRAAREASANARLPDYDSFRAHIDHVFSKMNGVLGGSEEQVSGCIYKAVTDGSDQLRYLATEDIESFVRARRESSEAEYMSFMRSQFGM